MLYKLLLGAALICCCLKGPNFDQYQKYIEVPATEYMPDLSFELTGIAEQDGFYYPVKLVIKTNDRLIQELTFDEEFFSPCTMDDFGFGYGDFKFDGYGGFSIYKSSMGKTPSCYFWIWDKEEHRFVEYPDLEELTGYTTFDYKNELVHVSATTSAERHEFQTYQYIDDQLTLIELVVDADSDGYRKVYKLIDNELKLTEVTESRLRG